jgi:phosphate transport system substrate-binding protein
MMKIFMKTNFISPSKTFSKIFRPFAKLLSLSLVAALAMLFIAEFALAQSGDRQIEEDYFSYSPFQNSEPRKPEEPLTFSLAEEKKWNLPRLDGSTSAIPLYAMLMEYVYPTPNNERKDKMNKADNYDSVWEVFDYSKTWPAFMNLLDGNADIFFTPSYTQKMKDTADSRGIKIKVTRIAKDAFVFIVNASNPVSNISSKKLRDIYSGKIDNWSDVGGKDAEIIAYQRNEFSGSQLYFTSFMGSQRAIAPIKSHTLQRMEGLVLTVTDYENGKNALGYTFRFFVMDMIGGKDIKLLNVDGIEPSLENIQSEKYPLAVSVYAITVEKDPEKETKRDVNAREFVKWMTSSQGQKAVKEVGYSPIR